MAGINEIKKDLKKLKKRAIDKFTTTVYECIDVGDSTDFESPEEWDACYRKQKDEFLKNQIRDPKKCVIPIKGGIDLLVGSKDGQLVIQFRDDQYVLDGKKYRKLDKSERVKARSCSSPPFKHTEKTSIKEF
jgi:hypothetical protein